MKLTLRAVFEDSGNLVIWLREFADEIQLGAVRSNCRGIAGYEGRAGSVFFDWSFTNGEQIEDSENELVVKP